MYSPIPNRLIIEKKWLGLAGAILFDLDRPSHIKCDYDMSLFALAISDKGASSLRSNKEGRQENTTSKEDIQCS